MWGVSWDLISHNSLSLCKDVNGGNYFLVGKHVVESTPQRAQVDSPVVSLLCQSCFQRNSGVSLVESVMIPPRPEVILEEKFAKRAKSCIGIVELRSRSSNAARQGFSVARVVVKTDNRTVPLGVLNAFTNQIEFVARENLI